MPNRLLQFSLLAAFLALASCASRETGQVIYSPGDKAAEADPDRNRVEVYNDPFLRQRVLADMLYEARMAFEDNRLMAPAGNNAYDQFRTVLDFDPDNEVARQGILDIVGRYVDLADAAIAIGQFDNAQGLLDRAARIGENRELVAAARNRLAQARDVKMDVYALDARALASRDLDIMVKLGEIGQLIRDQEATFLINARSDEEGRWIYQVMRQAVGGFRLRGNIAITSEPSIQVTFPGT